MRCKDDVACKRHYPRLCPDILPITTCQAFELHDWNKSRHKVIENSLKIGHNHSRQRKHKRTIRVENNPMWH